MTVTMPDGTVVRNVPDGTTKEQLLAKLQPAPSGAFKTLRALGQVVPVAEVAAREVSGLIGTSAGGLAGLGTLATN